MHVRRLRVHGGGAGPSNPTRIVRAPRRSRKDAARALLTV